MEKTVPLERKTVTVNGDKIWTGNASGMTSAQMMSDNGVYNPVAKVLEQYYAETMRNIAVQFDNREMNNIAKQIKAKRKRVGQ